MTAHQQTHGDVVVVLYRDAIALFLNNYVISEAIIISLYRGIVVSGETVVSEKWACGEWSGLCRDLQFKYGIKNLYINNGDRIGSF